MPLRKIMVAAVLGLVLAMGLAPARAEPPHLRIGWVVVPSDLAPLMFLKPGLAPHAGKTYTPELTHFAGTSTIMTALASGQLDCAALAYSTFALGIENAGMQDLRVIADSFMDGVPGYHTNTFDVRKDSPIHTIQDLKGKILATNETGSAIDMALRAMLAKHNLKDKRDVTIIEVRFPDQKAMLREGKADLISAVAPFGFDPGLRSFARPLFTQHDAIGRTQMIMRVAREGFLKKHHAMMVDFMEDYLHTLHYLSDPAHHEEAVKLITEVTKQKPQLYESWVFTKRDYYRDPEALPDLNALQANVNTQHQLGFLKTSLDVKKYADLSIVKEAAQKLAKEEKH
ncbi:MAG TPA: ABC transporter substrate-binding protein [Stellaceae bacterium]|nr:ABC transporter substrate-binding protein [Stellaceae bacterium]